MGSNRLRLHLPIISLLFVLVAMTAACEKDPHKAETWIPKLDEPATLDEAVRNLERLKDPAAIPPLAKVWEKYNQNSRILRAIISIAQGGKTPEGDRPPTWKPAIPVLVKAVESFDATAERSIEDAVVALDALRQAAEKETLQVIINAAQKPLPRLSPANRVKIAAVRSLGAFDDPRAIDVLIKILEGDPKKQLVQLNAAAALSLAETGPAKAMPALKKAMFIGPIFNQVRSAITRIGKPAEAEMLAILRGKDKMVNQLAKEQDFDKVAPGTREFKSALILGDLRSDKAVPLLTKGLKGDSVVSYYDERTQAPGPGTHMAYLQSLQMIGDPKTADDLYAFATSDKTDDGIRPRAIDVYSWVARDDKILPQLLKWMEDENAEIQMRFVSAVAYGRIARKKSDTGPVKKLIASAKKKIEGFKKDADKARKAKKMDQVTRFDAKRTVEERWRDTLEEAVTRIELAAKCKTDANCYAAVLDQDDVGAGQKGLVEAERAMIELYRMGDKAASATDKLLEHAGTSERVLRDGINLALPRIAKLPCQKCADQLGAVLEKQRNQTTLDALNTETKIVYHYFLWAGK